MINSYKNNTSQNHLLSNVFYSKQDNLESKNYSQYKFEYLKQNTNPNIPEPINVFYDNYSLSAKNSNNLPLIEKRTKNSRDKFFQQRTRNRSRGKIHRSRSQQKRAVSQMNYYEIKQKIFKDQQQSYEKQNKLNQSLLSQSRLNIFEQDETKENTMNETLNESKVIDIYKSLSIEPKRNNNQEIKQTQYRVYNIENENQRFYNKPMKQRERSEKLKQQRKSTTQYQDINKLEQKNYLNQKTLNELISQYKKLNKGPQKNRILISDLKKLQKQIEKTQINTVLTLGDNKEIEKDIQNQKNQIKIIDQELENLNQIEKNSEKTKLIQQYLQQKQHKISQEQKITDTNWLDQKKEKLLQESEKYKTQQLREIEISISLETKELLKWMNYIINKKQLNFFNYTLKTK